MLVLFQNLSVQMSNRILENAASLAALSKEPIIDEDFEGDPGFDESVTGRIV